LSKENAGNSLLRLRHVSHTRIKQKLKDTKRLGGEGKSPLWMF